MAACVDLVDKSCYRPSNMSQQTLPNKLAMAAFARRAASAHNGEVSLTLESMQLAIGDPITDARAALDVGASKVAAWIDGIRDDDDGAVIVVRVRDSQVVRWIACATAGVDSGVFGVWDAAQPARESAGKRHDDATYVGACMLEGRLTMALQTGDGHFAAVAGLDSRGEVACVVAGPGVDPERFGILDEATERAAAEAAAQRNAAITHGPLGENACPVASFFLMPLDESVQAAARACSTKLRAAADEKKAKAERATRLGKVLSWAVLRLRALTVEPFPAEAGALPTFALTMKGKIAWAKPIFDLYDYALTARRFDLEQALKAWPGSLATARGEVTPARLARLGVTSLRNIRQNVDFAAKGYKTREEDVPQIISGIAGALESAFELAVLESFRKNLAGESSSSSGEGFIDGLLDRLDALASGEQLLADL